MSLLQNGDPFPHLAIAANGGCTVELPYDLEGSFGVVLAYRGSWCPFCIDQLTAFAGAADKLAMAGIKVFAFSADDEATTAATIARLSLPFKVGHGADPAAVSKAIGSFTGEHAGHDIVQPSGFVLAPNGTVVNAVYSSNALGRLDPDDVVRMVTYIKSKT